MRALSAYSTFGVAGGSSGLSAAGLGSSQIRLSSETKSMVFAGDGRSSPPLCPLPSFSTVEGLSGRLLAAVRPLSSICLLRTFSTALLCWRRANPSEMWLKVFSHRHTPVAAQRRGKLGKRRCGVQSRVAWWGRLGPPPSEPFRRCRPSTASHSTARSSMNLMMVCRAEGVQALGRMFPVSGRLWSR